MTKRKISVSQRSLKVRQDFLAETELRGYPAADEIHREMEGAINLSTVYELLKPQKKNLRERTIVAVKAWIKYSEGVRQSYEVEALAAKAEAPPVAGSVQVSPDPKVVSTKDWLREREVLKARLGAVGAGGDAKVSEGEEDESSQLRAAIVQLRDETADLKCRLWEQERLYAAVTEVLAIAKNRLEREGIKHDDIYVPPGSAPAPDGRGPAGGDGGGCRDDAGHGERN